MNELVKVQELAARTTNMSDTKTKFIQKPKRLPVGFPMIIKPDCMSQGKGIFLTCELEKIP